MMIKIENQHQYKERRKIKKIMNNDKKILREQIKILLRHIRDLEQKSISFDKILYYKGLYEDYDDYMNY